MSRVIKKEASELPDIPTTVDLNDRSNTRRAVIIDRSTYEARSEAQVIRDRVMTEIEALREQAHAEALEMKQKAYQQGYEEGKQAGAQELTELVAQTSLRLQQIEAQAEPQLKMLALTIAKKILGHELEFHPETVVDIIRQALSEKARQRREIYLRVHPDDLHFVRENKPALIEVLSRCKEIGLREDPGVARHGVIIETEAGTIDAQLDTQLEVFERVLKATK